MAIRGVGHGAPAPEKSPERSPDLPDDPSRDHEVVLGFVPVSIDAVPELGIEDQSPKGEGGTRADIEGGRESVRWEDRPYVVGLGGGPEVVPFPSPPRRP